MSAINSPKASILFHDLFVIMILVSIGLGIGLTLNQLRDKPLLLVYESKDARMKRAVASMTKLPLLPQNKKSVILPNTVTLNQLQEFLKDKRGVVFDARPEIFYRLGHIPGTLSLPREDFENAYKTFRASLERDQNQPLMIYCANVSCEDAGLVQKSLRVLGYSNVAVFSGGWSEWQENGLPTEGRE